MSATRTWLRTPLEALAGLALALACAAFVARFVPVTNHAVLAIAALSPYLSLGAVIAAVLLVVTGRRPAAAVTAVLATVAASVQLPLFISGGPAVGVPLRVMTANVMLGSADPDALATLARQHADVLVLQELTPDLAAALDTRMTADFPHRSLKARVEAAGAGIWSRHPITGSGVIEGYQLGTMNARIAVPGAAETTVLGIHIGGPWPQPIDGWRHEIAQMKATLRDFAAQARTNPVIVAGDFNATYDMADFRALFTDGYRDAAEQSGAGLTRTFPANMAVPPLIGIDHIITRGATAQEVRTVRVPGSDHLGLVATVRLSR